MTSRRLNRNELARFFNSDPRAIREFERLLERVQANIAGPASVTLNYANDGTLTSPLPTTANYTLVPEGGSAFRSGVSWGVRILSGSFVGSDPTIGGTGTGVLQINSGLATNSALLGVTATVDGVGYPPYSVTIAKNTSPPETGGGGATPTDSTSSLSTFNSGTFAAITRDLVVTLPVSATEATLTAAALSLELGFAFPAGTTTVEMKWQRETAPSVWADVGAVATSSPSPFVFDEEGFPSTVVGEITCNRTETGLTGGSTETFRLVARVSAGNVRTVYPFGIASVAS